MSPENIMGTSHRCVNSTCLATSALIYSLDEPASGQAAHTATIEDASDSTSQRITATSTSPSGLQSLWGSSKQRGISDKAAAIILSS